MNEHLIFAFAIMGMATTVIFVSLCIYLLLIQLCDWYKERKTTKQINKLKEEL